MKSKVLNLEIVQKDDKYWNTPADEVYFLVEKWKEKGFNLFVANTEEIQYFLQKMVLM